MNIDVRNCARCGQDHDALTFKQFQRPVTEDKDKDNETILWTHWAVCPVTDDPILLRLIKIETKRE